jgi:hypothetical protein
MQDPSEDRLAIVDPEDDLPPDVSGQPPLERVARPSQRQDRVQHRPNMAGVDQPRDLDELCPARLHDPTYAASWCRLPLGGDYRVNWDPGLCPLGRPDFRIQIRTSVSDSLSNQSLSASSGSHA